jgi:hypothetical protein
MADVEPLKNPASPTEANKAPAPSMAGGALVQLGTGIDIISSSRLPDYDVGEVKAYQAMERGGSGAKYIALVCEPHLVPRLRTISNYSAILHPSLAVLVNSGTVFWPLVAQERYVFVYKDTLGKKVMKEGSGYALAWRQEAVMNAVVEPMIKVLQEFRNKEFVHGAIRPSNMFYSGPAAKPEPIVLGDCLSVPAFYGQPILFETIERSMTDPLARGAGALADDIYAFGVTLAVMLRSTDPCEGMPEREIIREKIKFGSYSALTGKDRFKGFMLELLRGVLHDDPAQRWTIEEILAWQDGRRGSPKQSIPQKKAPRALTFDGEKYFQLSLLAMDLGRNPPEVEKIVENKDLEQWLKRSVEDDETLQRVDAAVTKTAESGTGHGHDERLVAYLSMALDPLAPLRYKGKCVRADGFGPALAAAIVQKHDLNVYAEMLLQGTILSWISNYQGANLDVTSWIGRFDSCRSYMRQSRAGFGIERSVYVLCPEVHCLSDKLARYFVRSPEDMIIAFEDLCRKGDAPALFLDRHSVAFLSVRDSKLIDSYMSDFESPDQYKKVLGNLKCLAAIQKRPNMGQFPGIAKAFLSMLDPVYARYHDRDFRKKIQTSINEFAVAGNLVKMSELLDNVGVIAKDLSAFYEAMEEYRELSKESARLMNSLAEKDVFGKTTGKHVAAGVSALLACIIIVTVAFWFFTKGSQVF